MIHSAWASAGISLQFRLAGLVQPKVDSGKVKHENGERPYIDRRSLCLIWIGQVHLVNGHDTFSP